MGRVVRLYTAPEASDPMEPQESIEVLNGGIAGDRYLRGTGYYLPYDVCEITLIGSEALAAVCTETGIDLRDGRHRRNIVTRDHELTTLLETTFRIGTAKLRGTRPRPPCSHLEDVAGEDGLMDALGERRGGICARVITPGSITVDDGIEITEPDPRTIGASIAERLEEGVDRNHPDGQ